jgi:hypothetical protein
MRRRDFVKAAVSSSILAAPRVAGADGAKVLKFRPLGDLAVLDPVWTPARPTRNHGYLVFDTLFGIDENFMPQPQMADGYLIEDDGKEILPKPHLMAVSVNRVPRITGHLPDQPIGRCRVFRPSGRQDGADSSTSAKGQSRPPAR